MNYTITYKTNTDGVATVTLNAANKVHLAQLILERVTDMKDDDSDHILGVKEER